MLIFLYKTLCKVSKVYFWYGAKGCQYLVIQSNECLICLLIDSGYWKTNNRGTF